ncbi:MAG: DUF2207 domain-containing protein [Roseburia sp.]|nr:DUF2207 domain-containing protein [Roseburia sp.]
MYALLSTTTDIGFYYATCACVYGCLAAILLLALVYGTRAKRNVAEEKVTALPQGFSPLDVQRIFIGKTFPRRLTRALLVHWAQNGFISVECAGRYSVRVYKLKSMPSHYSDAAVFFDRGTYVRERMLFDRFADKIAVDPTVSLLKPLFTSAETDDIRKAFAAREDEGVYTAKHYMLKVIALALSVVSFAASAIWIGIDTGNFVTLVLVGFALVGMSVLMFVKGMPILFKTLWCGIWLGCSIGPFIAFAQVAYDPYGTTYVSVALFFIGPLFLRRFADYREKINLADYSMIVNYRRFLLRTGGDELGKYDYYAALPFIYAFGIKFAVKRKFGERRPPEWYKPDPEIRSALL